MRVDLAGPPTHTSDIDWRTSEFRPMLLRYIETRNWRREQQAAEYERQALALEGQALIIGFHVPPGVDPQSVRDRARSFNELTANLRREASNLRRPEGMPAEPKRELTPAQRAFLEAGRVDEGAGEASEPETTD